ncbi:MAG: hypothetical protein IT432_00800 [Phycisphaerales bacterium]|nr:hypothetical protein [Phycisphaerales bacterium]
MNTEPTQSAERKTDPPSLAASPSACADMDALLAEVHANWSGFWQFLVAVDRLLRCTASGARHGTEAPPTDSLWSVRPSQAGSEPALPSTSKGGAHDIGRLLDDAESERRVAEGERLGESWHELTRSEQFVARLRASGFKVTDIVQYATESGDTRVPRSRSRVYDLLRGVREKLEKAADGRQRAEKSRTNADKPERATGLTGRPQRQT